MSSAYKILQENEHGNQPKINLEGIMAGNPWTYMPIDNFGAIFYWWSHGLISDSSYNGLVQECNLTNIGPLKMTSELADSDPTMCDNFISTADNEMGNINIYDIYVDVCLSSNSLKGTVEQLARSGSPLHRALLTARQQRARDRPLPMDINPPYQPCSDEFTQSYLNLAAVRAALHVDSPNVWTDCSTVVSYNYSDVEKSVIPLYHYFIATNAIKILVYSGDVDAIVPYTGTRQWVADLSL